MSLVEEKQQPYEFVWKIEGDEFHRCKQAKAGDAVECKEFELCQEMWKISIYPKGTSEDEQQVVISLECKSINAKEILAVSYGYICKELDYKIDDECCFPLGWPAEDTDTNKNLDKFKDIDKLTVRFIIYSVVKSNKDKKDEFEWTINTIAYDKTTTYMESASFPRKDTESEWYLQLTWKPFDGDCYISLEAEDLNDVIRCSYTIEMTDIQHTIRRCFPFKVGAFEDKGKLCSLENIKQSKQCKIKVIMNDTIEAEPALNDRINWNISGDLLQQFKCAKIGDSFLSPKQCIGDDTFLYLLIEPSENKNVFNITLIPEPEQLFYEPTKIHYVITCEEINYVHESTFMVKGDVAKSILQFSAVWNQVALQKLETLNITCKIDVQKEELEEKDDFCYVNNKDTKIKFDEITQPDGFEQDSSDDDEKDDTVLYDKHRSTLETWNENSAKLQAMSDTDEKKQNNTQSKHFGIELYKQYSQCSAIIQQQTTRLKQVTTNDHLLELISRNNELSELKKIQELKIKSPKEHDAQIKEYQSLRQKRIEFQNQIKIQFMQCNNMIQRESEILAQLKESERRGDKLQKNIEKITCSSQSCVEMIKLYNKFMEDNKKYIDDVTGKFNKLWDEFESKWMKWDMNDIVIWFKYRTMKMNTDKIEWSKIENELKSRNISGKSLAKFNDLTFELIGLKDFEIVNHLVGEIEVLQKKYDGDGISTKSKGRMVVKSTKIPKKYICPITKQIMQDPVLAFDGFSYERTAIEGYLKIHSKSPVTGAKADYVIVFPNHTLKEDIQLYIKENNVDLEKQNNQSKEGNLTEYH